MNTIVNDTVKRQQDYVQTLDQQQFDFGLVISEAFVKSMRDIGYKSTATALAEEIDNSIEAGARDIHVLFNFGGDSDAKPSQIAVVDDGHGMVPRMIRAAVIWGGTHRHGSRELFGRYGFGLPSSCISQGRRFEVYSKNADGAWFMCYIDLDEIASGKFSTSNGRPVAPEPIEATPPKWVLSALKSAGAPGLPETGTVVIIDKLDRLTWKTTTTLERNLLPWFGTTYRKLLRDTAIWVNGKKVEKVDPLFLDEDARYYGENDIKASAQEPTIIDLKEKGGAHQGTITVRYAYLPPGFQNLDGKPGSGENKRHAILKDNNGILFLRAGRQLDVVNSKCPWATFGIYDYNVKIEVDFPPSLDEEFSVTTSKQQVVPSDRVWEILEQHGVKRALHELRGKYKREAKALSEEQSRPSEGKKRTSEQVMEEAERFATGKRPNTPTTERERREGFDEEVKRRQQSGGKTEEQARAELESDVKLHPFRIDFEEVPEGPMFRPEGVGAQVVVWINRAHPFFTDLYESRESQPHTKSALELLLFILGESELDSEGHRREFYRTERVEWSRKFATTLRLLEKKDPMATAVGS